MAASSARLLTNSSCRRTCNELDSRAEGRLPTTQLSSSIALPTRRIEGASLHQNIYGVFSHSPLVKTTSDGNLENLWRDLFSDPSQWWDNRSRKPNPKFPDFKHKQTGQGLWVIDRGNPPWVALEITSLPPGSSIFSQYQRLSRCNKAGQYEKTMEYFEQMQQAGIKMDGFVLVHVVNACAGLRLLEKGRHIHRQILETGSKLHLYVSSALVDMYSKCGSIDEAWGVFNSMPARDVVAWNAMILGCVKCGDGWKALELFQFMLKKRVVPTSVTFVGLLNACASIDALEEGRRLHEQIILGGFETDIYVISGLLDMYAKCGSIDEAWLVFNKFPRRNVVAWNAMILGCVNCGEYLKALELFEQMRLKGVEPTAITFVGLLNACASMLALEEGRCVHEEIIRRGLESDDYVSSSLVDMFAKCGSVNEARKVFNNMPRRDVVAWTAMIFGYVKCGEGLQALNLFHQMQRDGAEPNSCTFVGVLNACGSIAALDEGRLVHEKIIRSGLESDGFVANSLIDMYSKCGSIHDARKVFNNTPKRDVVGWNAMILGCVKCGESSTALELFRQMQLDGVEPNSHTFVGVLNACASEAALEEGRLVHEQVLRSGLEADIYVHSSLVDMYCKCGSLHDGWRVLKSMPTSGVLGWNSIIRGCVKHGGGLTALDLFRQMQLNGLKPDSRTFVAVLNACALTMALEEGRHIHKQIRNSNYKFDIYVGNSLIDMYAKCGSIGEARLVFDEMPVRNVVTWTAMIMGCAKHGLPEESIAIFEQMSGTGCEMNEVTFISLLSACSHGGLVKEGIYYFERMSSVYGIAPMQEHYNCMVNMLCQAGLLDQAEKMLKSMPFEPNVADSLSVLPALQVPRASGDGRTSFKTCSRTGSG